MDASANADTELTRCIAEGDLRRAGALLVARYADEVYALCRAMVRDASAAEDLSQDVFGRAFVALAEYRGDASPRTWLLRIARNRCVDHLRALRRDPRGLDDEPDAHPADEPLAIDALLSRADVAQALSALEEGERALVVLRFGHGLDYAELAAAFGLREGTVRMRVSRAVAKMRQALAPSRRRARLEEGALARDEEARDTPADAFAAPSPPAAYGAPPGAPPARRPAPPPAPAAAAAPRVAPSAAPLLRWAAPPALRARLEALAAR